MPLSLVLDALRRVRPERDAALKIAARLATPSTPVESRRLLGGPREALIAKLRSLTNVRVVDDATASTGYKVDLAPFPGWKRVPSW